jgi:acyl phosphate:glycerol-3-phosphate acyltransferase
MKIILIALAGFLLGSIPTGKIIAGGMGIDLRKTGSGNIGATNVLRSAGKLPALFTLIGDMAKGSAAVLFAQYFEVGYGYEGMIGLIAVLGHNYSLFLHFKGGKGVATSLGVLIVYAPLTGLVTVMIWLLTVLITRISSLGAIISFSVLPLSLYLLDAKEKLPISFIMSIIVLMRHKDNIHRLIRGTEPKVGRKS